MKMPWLFLITLLLLGSSITHGDPASSGNNDSRLKNEPPLSSGTQQLSKWAIKSNAADTSRSMAPFLLENYEIPIEKVAKLFGTGIPQDVLSSLMIHHDGQTFVRWIKSPEDTKYYKILERHLHELGVPTERHRDFIGRMTESRSLIVHDPVTGAEFSAKVSTDRTGGNFVGDKDQTVQDAKQIRAIDDLVELANRRSGGFKNFVVMREPVIFGLKGIDQAMVIRLLGDLPKGDQYYLPGFSALHEDEGRRIARLNGAKTDAEVAAFWNENYNKPLARAMAELAAMAGVSYSSPHSQNFLIELEANMRPTGRIVFRDLGDARIHRRFMQLAGQKESLADIWDTTHIKTKIYAQVGLLKGNEDPKWLDDKTYINWSKDFFTEWEQTFSNMTGVPLDELRAESATDSNEYFKKVYTPQKYSQKLGSGSWNDYYRYAICMGSAKASLSCQELLRRMRAAAERPLAACLHTAGIAL